MIGNGGKPCPGNPKEDSAVIRRALDVLQAWDAWIYDVTPTDTAIESLRAAITAAGYLEGGDRG